MLAAPPKTPPLASVSVSLAEAKFTVVVFALLKVSELMVAPPKGTVSVTATATLLLAVDAAKEPVNIALESIRIPVTGS